ncbi:MAG: hypothetical protein FWD13_03825 [Treponema sp.]|nr:hypothetical protein [Treponema sp.]
MTLGEKSAAVTGGESSPDRIKRSGSRDNSGIYAFSDVVDNACKGLRDRQIKFSIRRIQDMEGRLSEIEQELDLFLENSAEMVQKNRDMA